MPLTPFRAYGKSGRLKSSMHRLGEKSTDAYGKLPKIRGGQRRKPQRKQEILYYFFDMTDVEIAELMKIPRSTVQYRRTSSFELLKRYLEERADEWDEL